MHDQVHSLLPFDPDPRRPRGLSAVVYLDTAFVPPGQSSPSNWSRFYFKEVWAVICCLGGFPRTAPSVPGCWYVSPAVIVPWWWFCRSQSLLESLLYGLLLGTDKSHSAQYTTDCDGWRDSLLGTLNVVLCAWKKSLNCIYWLFCIYFAQIWKNVEDLAWWVVLMQRT